MRCLHWKVVAALGAAGVVIWLAAPGTAAAGLPLLVVLACPLSMVVMMRAMGIGASRRESPGSEVEDLRAEVATLRRERDTDHRDKTGGLR